MEQATVKTFFTRVDELLDDETYKLAQFQDFTQGLVRNLIKSSTFTKPVGHFVKQQPEEAVASETRFSQDMSREISVKEEITLASPLIGSLQEISETLKDNKNERKRDKPSSHHQFNCSSCSKCSLSRQSDEFEVHEDDKEPKEARVLMPTNTHITAALLIKT